MITAELLAFFKGPVAGALGTASQEGTPTFTRLLGVTAQEGGRELRVLIPRVLSEQALSDFKENARAAVTVADITTMQSRQFKGTFVGAQDATPTDEEVVREYFAATMPVVSGFFGPTCGTGWERLNVAPCVALTIAVDVLYNQTPGPDAGKVVS